MGGLPHDGGRQVTPFDGRGQEHRLDLRHHGVIGVGELDLILEIRDRAQPPYHDGGPLLLGKAHGQAVEGIHLHVGHILAALPQHGNALLDRKQRRLRTVDQHGDDQLVKHTAGALDDIQMPAGNGVKAAGIHGNGHGTQTFPLPPYLLKIKQPWAEM